MPQELGWIVQPNLSFGVTLGCPENPGRMRGGSKEGCLGWWHGREHSLEKPLSSSVVEESLRTAQVLGCLRSRKLGCESQSCTPGVSVAVWDDLGKSHSSRTGRDSTSPAHGEGNVPAGISFPHRIPSLPTLLLPGCPPGAAPFPLHPQILPFRGAQQGGIHPATRTEIPQHSPALPRCTGGSSQQKSTLGKRPKSLGGRIVGFALLISHLNWPRIKTQQGKAEFPAWGSDTPSIPSPTTHSAMPTLPIPPVLPQALTGMTLRTSESPRLQSSACVRMKCSPCPREGWEGRAGPGSGLYRSHGIAANEPPLMRAELKPRQRSSGPSGRWSWCSS